MTFLAAALLSVIVAAGCTSLALFAACLLLRMTQIHSLPSEPFPALGQLPAGQDADAPAGGPFQAAPRDRFRRPTAETTNG